jgi:hypothetical protein
MSPAIEVPGYYGTCGHAPFNTCRASGYNDAIMHAFSDPWVARSSSISSSIVSRFVLGYSIRVLVFRRISLIWLD